MSHSVVVAVLKTTREEIGFEKNKEVGEGTN